MAKEFSYKKFNAKYRIVEDRHIVSAKHRYEGMVSDITNAVQLEDMVERGSPYVELIAKAKSGEQGAESALRQAQGDTDKKDDKGAAGTKK